MALLAPLSKEWPEEYSSEDKSLSTGQLQQVFHVNYQSFARDFLVVGPSIWPVKLSFEINGKTSSQQIHELDLSNLYTIDRSWECGSCPHLFLGEQTGQTGLRRRAIC